MLKRWLTGWDLRDRWSITQSDLADMILGGEIVAHEPETLNPIDVQKEKKYISYLHNNPRAPERALIPTLIDRAFELSFRASDVAAYENLNGIVPHESTARADHMDASDRKPEASTPDETKQDRPNVRKTVALEGVKTFKKNHPNLTQKQAAAMVNEWLKDNELEQYSEKHLIKIIKPLKFKPGKPGRPPEK